jgi:UDP-N-acetylmuramoyl-tripeptide--D-alanyl-D-alanine ligase
MKKVKKLLYLLQLVWLSLAFSLPLSILLGQKRAVIIANKIAFIFFKIVEEILVFLARFKLSFISPPTRIVITGSYGKTTFKEMLAWVLESKYLVLKTPENINTRIGISQLILKKLLKKHQLLVFEAAAYQPGEIKAICQLVKPNFGVITAFGWMHLERFKTFSNIRTTKMELVPFIQKKENIFMPSKNHQMIDFEKTCVSIASLLGINPNQTKARLKKFVPPAHRLTIKTLAPKVIALDNTYNSNPLGFERALKKLALYKGYQKIVVTPGMIELGEKQNSLNQKLASQASGIADLFVIVGETNKKALQKGAKKVKKIYLDKNEPVEERLTSVLRPPTVILLENELPDHYF